MRGLVLVLVLVQGVVGEEERVERGPPRGRKESGQTVVGRVGEEVRLVCPVVGRPHPVFEWKKVSRGKGGTWED